jgi:hypothetical protein
MAAIHLCIPNPAVRLLIARAGSSHTRSQAPIPNEFCRPNTVMKRGLRPVGTRGCGEGMRGPCACPRGDTTMLPDGTPTNRAATRTSTRPPPIPTSAPCPYRTEADVSCYYPIRLSKIIRIGATGSRPYMGIVRTWWPSLPRLTWWETKISSTKGFS